MKRLIDILELRRHHDSDGEQIFIDTYLKDAQELTDPHGTPIAYTIEIGPMINRVLWSCHIDTMHRAPILNEVERTHQEVWVDTVGTAFVMDTEDCLGADDGAGAWLLLEMIDANVPGTYIFHRGEEIGCWGSSRVAKHYRDWLATYTHAVAFDRKGTHSAITHQMGERGASDAFANQLIGLIDMGHELDPTGVYTDTAEYMEIIPECMNFSAGYYNEHRSEETLDTTYLLQLRDALLAVDWNVEFVVDRDPSVKEYDNWAGNYALPHLLTTTEIASTPTLDIMDWVESTDPYTVAETLKRMAVELEGDSLLSQLEAEQLYAYS